MTDIASEFIWRGFENQYTDLPEPATERMMEPIFKRNYTVFRVGHFATRIIELDKKFQLPNGSILHVADNFEHWNNPSDLPDVANNVFMTRETYKKYIYHVTALNTTGPIVYEDKYILRMAGLPSKLMQFRIEQGNNFKYVLDKEALPTKREALIVVNHNPIFRMRLFGRMQFFRKFQQMLASILNTCCELSYLNKNQFLMIPWGTNYYDKAEFIRSRTALTMTSVKHPEDLQYLFMLHLINFLHSDAVTSMLSKLPDEVLSQLYIVPYRDEKYIFYNLKELKELNYHDLAYRRIVAQLNTLALLSRDDAKDNPIVDTTITETEIDKDISEVNEDTDVESTGVKKVIETVASTVTKDAVSTVADMEKKVERMAEFVKPDAPDTKLTKGINVTPVSIDVSEATATIHAVSKNNKEVKNTKTVVKVNTATNVTDIDKSEADNDKYSKEYVDDLTKDTETFIDNSDLTPAAKNRYKKLAIKYKDLTIGGVKLSKLLEETEDIKLTDNRLDPKQLGIVPDESELECTMSNFDKDYVDKTFHKHLAGIITSFQKNGAYLINVKEEKVITDLHNYTQYSCQYEDIRGKKSTVKFKIPNITSNGAIIVDGVPQIIKKQRIPLPIIKISDSVISLSSNYNKTRVVRNTTKAHNFGAYVHSFVNDPNKSNCTIVYGHSVVNLPLSYEYISLGNRYKTIQFKADGDVYNLYFHYNTRQEVFNDKPELLAKLEAEYGVYFGYTKNLWLFINNQNKVSALKQTGGEVVDYPYASLLDVCRLSMKEEYKSKPKSFTEWINITILDTSLPVIFMLAYRYGLRATLDYLGAKYTITENRSKTIVGENTIVGEESFGVDSDNVIPNYSDDIIIGTEALRRPVKPRLGDVTIILTKRSATGDYGSYTVMVRAFVITVNLGRTTSVKRRITNYDSTTFTTSDLNELPRELVDKASAYLRCGIRKISKAQIVWIPADKSIPKDVAAVAKLTPIEFKKLTSKLNIDENKVRPANEDLTEEVKYVPQPNDIHIKFADRVLHFNRYPLAHSLILSGLAAFDLSGYDMSELENKDTYFRILVNNKMSANYLKGIDSFYDLFVDNMTYTVLKMMHEPTNVRDLLIRCAVLLSTTDFAPASSAMNHRIRGYEQLAAIVCNELSREFAGYQSRHNAANVFSVNPDAIYLHIIQNSSMVPYDSCGPLEDIKLRDSMTYAGIGGRTGESFVISDRRYDESDVGVISEAAPDNGKVGLNATLSHNPNIKGTLGIIESKEFKDIKPSEAWSIHALVFPGALSDDTKRVNFIGIQSSHLVPTKRCDISRYRTGYERILAHNCSRNFAGVAEQDGKVTNIDTKAEIIEVAYADGTKDVFSYGHKCHPFASIGIDINLLCDVKVGQKLKKGDVITHNPNYFQMDHDTKQLDYSIGVQANVAMIEQDSTVEDSCEISDKLSDRLSIAVANDRVISLSAKSVIYQYAKIGDIVKHTDNLMIFDEEPTAAASLTRDDTTLAMLAELNRSTPSAKFSGEVVQIDAYYGCEISEMSPTVAALVKQCITKKTSRSKLASNSTKSAEYPASTVIRKGSKYKGVTFDENTVMFIFHIREDIKNGIGDKVIFSNQLKCTCGAIFQRKITTESGVEVDALFSQGAQNRRIVVSSFLTGIGTRILEKLEDDICLDYFGEPRKPD